MKRKYSSPVMEVEVFEASEYVAACYQCYNPILTSTTNSENDQSRAGTIYNLYLDSNNDGVLDFNSDKGINPNERCYRLTNHKINANPNEVKTGFWAPNILDIPNASMYTKVNIINRDGKYHIVKSDKPNHS